MMQNVEVKLMQKIKIIFNPSSGRGDNHIVINDLALQLLKRNYTVSLFTTTKAKDAFHESFKTAQSENWDLIISAGGDGTLNEIINGIMKSNCKINLAVFPLGTMNDFGKFLNIPKSSSSLADRIDEDHYSYIDVGKIDNHYFINVASMGVFTSVAHTTTKEKKNLLGPLAYYIEGLRQFSITALPKAHIHIESESFNYNDEFLLFLISNSSSIGGFHKMAPKACINDGKFDCILIKTAPIHKLFEIFLKIFNGQHIKSEYVEYFQTSNLEFETSDEIDIDGEYYGAGKNKVEIINNALKMIL